MNPSSLKAVLNTRVQLSADLLRRVRLMQRWHERAQRLAGRRLLRGLCLLMKLRQHRRIFRLYACDIAAEAQLGRVAFRHPLGIVIGGGARLADGVVVHQGVTFGALRFDAATGRGLPCTQVVEEGAVICAGAKVLGDVRIGRGAVVGANAVVTRDVPAGYAVVGFNKLIAPKDG